ncbi:hypothetical protein TIFTF001_048421 [Ficus carica]|uniref:Uncharacterized protein n=1 Tax=Ficus carica TaxID=3494 RepID=A0AA87ZF39_FICCA|nr:hypothetical protein TIFTF001_048421 [Ficus carica]
MENSVGGSWFCLELGGGHHTSPLPLIFVDHGYRPPPSLAPVNSTKAATPPSSLVIIGVFARECGAVTKKRERERDMRSGNGARGAMAERQTLEWVGGCR